MYAYLSPPRHLGTPNFWCVFAKSPATIESFNTYDYAPKGDYAVSHVFAPFEALPRHALRKPNHVVSSVHRSNHNPKNITEIVELPIDYYRDAGH